MLLMFQRAETTEQKQRATCKMQDEKMKDKKTPQLRGGKIIFYYGVNLNLQVYNHPI